MTGRAAGPLAAALATLTLTSGCVGMFYPPNEPHIELLPEVDTAPAVLAGSDRGHLELVAACYRRGPLDHDPDRNWLLGIRFRETGSGQERTGVWVVSDLSLAPREIWAVDATAEEHTPWETIVPVRPMPEDHLTRCIDTELAYIEHERWEDVLARRPPPQHTDPGADPSATPTP